MLDTRHFTLNHHHHHHHSVNQLTTVKTTVDWGDLKMKLKKNNLKFCISYDIEYAVNIIIFGCRLMVKLVINFIQRTLRSL